MPLHFVCPQCGSETLVDDEYVGQSGPCVSCGQAVSVPFLAIPATGSVPGPPADDNLTKSPRGQTLLLVIGGIAAAAVYLAVLVELVFPLVGNVRASQQKRTCNWNLRRIGEAILDYHQDHGRFPPAYIVDSRGKPMHSWRVLILPYLGEQALYSRYDFDKPWDSLENSGLTSLMPAVFACPSDSQAMLNGETSYMVIVGKRTAFPGRQARSLAEIRDDRTTTILVGETPVSGVTWLEPKDLAAQRMQYAINSGFALEIGSHHLHGANVVAADGRVLFLRDTTPSDYVQAMTTIDGGETIAPEALRE